MNSMTDMKFRVRANSESATKTVVKARKFEIVVDEPTELGGTDTGANPVELLLAAYAGCLNVVGHMVAGEMEMNLTSIKIDLVGNLDPAKLFGQETEERAGYKTIKVTMKPETDASEETINAWLSQVKERCPVGDNLKNITNVEIIVK